MHFKALYRDKVYIGDDEDKTIDISKLLCYINDSSFRSAIVDSSISLASHKATTMVGSTPIRSIPLISNLGLPYYHFRSIAWGPIPYVTPASKTTREMEDTRL